MKTSLYDSTRLIKFSANHRKVLFRCILNKFTKRHFLLLRIQVPDEEFTDSESGLDGDDGDPTYQPSYTDRWLAASDEEQEQIELFVV